MNIGAELARLHAAGLLGPLLADYTTGQPILWATDAYAALGPAYGRDRPITPGLITGENAGLIRTRAGKESGQRSQRTRSRGEVFTPLWVCGKMIDHADVIWFGRGAGFHKWDAAGHIRFTQRRPWRKYVDTTRLEITCGEAPFLCQRYDVETGEVLPVSERGGILDRKLRAVSENTREEADWLSWAGRALRAVYGYELSGDNLLIARVNMYFTAQEHFAAWRRGVAKKRARQFNKREGRRFAEIISRNLWQMDGLTGQLPYRRPRSEAEQLDFFSLLDGLPAPPGSRPPPLPNLPLAHRPGSSVPFPQGGELRDEV